MAFLIAMASCLLVIGAFLWLKPSKRDQHLAHLRTRAITQGFLISSVKLPDTSEHGRVNQLHRIETLYRLSLEIDTDVEQVAQQALRFTVQRTSGESGIYLPESWVWQERHNIDHSLYAIIAEYLAQLPEDISAVLVSQAFVGLVWSENTQRIDLPNILEQLQQLASACGLTLLR